MIFTPHFFVELPGIRIGKNAQFGNATVSASIQHMIKKDGPDTLSNQKITL